MNTRQESIDKDVRLAMMLAFYGYLDRDQETIDVVNQGMRAMGYPEAPPVEDQRR